MNTAFHIAFVKCVCQTGKEFGKENLPSRCNIRTGPKSFFSDMQDIITQLTETFLRLYIDMLGSLIRAGIESYIDQKTQYHKHY